MDSTGRQTVLDIIDTQGQLHGDGWAPLASLGKHLSAAGVDYKAEGYPKLRPFLDDFGDALEIWADNDAGKTPVIYVRRSAGAAASAAPQTVHPAAAPVQPASASAPEPFDAPAWEPTEEGQRTPDRDTWLYKWASISRANLQRLVELALPERWYYGAQPPADGEPYPILKNYLAYTFKRLVSEGKVVMEDDRERGEEYAAFNTGLVDKKYQSIYALFKQNTRYQGAYWYLIAFAVAGEDEGKTLVRLFNPLPAKADYFGDRLENMVYNTATGSLSCDYTHILVERTYRLPVAFFEENCPTGFTTIDGAALDDVADMDEFARRGYFEKLGQKIAGDGKILNRLKNRLDDAVQLALKRVEWNYKTAIPMYFPTRDTVSLLLPLALVDEDTIDLALVVERLQSGAYQGQTVLSLDLAYSDSRLVTRPDSDWLQTDMIAMRLAEDDEQD